MKNLKTLLAVVLGLATSSIAFAQQGPADGAAPAAQPWKYKTKQLNRAEVDALLAKPKKVIVIDVRRPDELTAKGGFPVYLSIQAKDIEKSLAYIPKDRSIITVSNHAHRAGAVADVLTSKGFKVAGATGSEDYEAQGGTAVIKIAPPKPKSLAQAEPKQ